MSNGHNTDLCNELQAIIKAKHKYKGDHISKLFDELNKFYVDYVGKTEFTQDITETSKMIYYKMFFIRFFRNFFNPVFLARESGQHLGINDNKIYLLNNSEYKLVFCDQLNFYLQKSYKNSHDENEVIREKTIFKENTSNYIVHMNEEKSKSLSQNNDIIIPYFPVGTLGNLIYNNLESKRSIKLSDTEKITIILEIASALDDLHINRQYHGNLCDQSIFINSHLDAYIGSVFYEKMNDDSKSVNRGPNFYRSPEKISAQNDQDGPNNQEGIFEYEQKNDIYSFGVLMHEIFTDTLPYNRLKEKSNDDRIKILKEGYKEFLFSGENNEFFEQEAKDNKKEEGSLKKIIEKCLSQNPKDRYSTMKEILQNIKELPIYERNKTEIEYRLSHSIDAREYQCTISDIVESYYLGQDSCLEDIKQMLSAYFKEVLSDGDQLTIITDIINNLQSNDPLTKIILEELRYVKYKQYQESDKDQFISLCKNFCNKINSNEVFDVPNEIKMPKYYFFIDDYVQNLLKNLINRYFFKGKNNELLEYYPINSDKEDKIHVVRDLLQFNEINSPYKLLFDKKMHFYLQKTYSPNIDEMMLARERRIFTSNFSKFIVCIDGQDQNQIVFPYFPIGTLESLMSVQNQAQTSTAKRRIEFDEAQKLIIILEICLALKDLHSHNEYHGNLSDKSIFINSKFDAYIGSICHSQKLESDATKPRFNQDNQQNQQQADLTEEEKINFEQKCDIYSFGALMYEIINNNSQETKEDQSLNAIIEKCLSQNPKDQYSTMEEILQKIKELPIYERNKTEIEYRLSHSIDAREYQCTISDIVESYFLGQDSCLEDIEKTLLLYKQLILSTDNETITCKEEDIIKSILGVFRIKNDFTHIFEDIFDFIIQKYLITKIDGIKSIDLDDKLLSLSNDVNNKKSLTLNENEELLTMNQDFDFIVPISTLEDFMKNNEDKIEDLMPTWMYFIAREVQFIHSKNLYHGSISPKSIGIYYNHETETFIPSIILFYPFYKQPKNEKNLSQNLSKSKIIEENQKKDIKFFKEKLEKLNEKYEIDSAFSINMIVYKLYNYIISETNEKQRQIFYNNYYSINKGYSQLQISFSLMRRMINSNNYILSFDNSFIDFGVIFKTIIEFLNNIENNPKQSIISNIPQIENNESNHCLNSEIELLLFKINSKCYNLYTDILSKREKVDDKNIGPKSEIIFNDKDGTISYKREKESDQKIENSEKEAKNHPGFNFANIIEYKKKYLKGKVERIKKRRVYRTLEYDIINIQTFEFLLRRYIYNLDPNFKYIIKIKVKELANQNSNFTVLGTAKKIVESIHTNWGEPVENNDWVYVFVNINEAEK